MFGPSFPETHGGVVMVVGECGSRGEEVFEKIFFNFPNFFLFFKRKLKEHL